MIREILDGKRSPRRDVVLINAAAALMAAERAHDFKQGVALAAQSIDSGSAKKKLEELVKFTNQHR
jgi:anthranilate phosphoribosyltransferase